MDVKIDFTSIKAVRKLINDLYLSIKMRDLIIKEQNIKIKKYERQISDINGTAFNKPTVHNAYGWFGKRIDTENTDRN